MKNRIKLAKQPSSKSDVGRVPILLLSPAWGDNMEGVGRLGKLQ